MGMDTINNLPAHPLLVHGSVVLIPLTALLLVLCAAWPAMGHRISWLLPALAVVALVCVLLTTDSGEWLEERVPETALMEEHAEMGENLTPWAVGLLIGALLVWLVDLLRSSKAEPSGPGSSSGAVRVALSLPVRIAVSVIAVVLAAGSVVETYWIGDSGAKAVWENRVSPHSGD
ncbi:hypothetical protein N566_25330 [Streptomycetaceae bacterium MP113-05]|nr:hypothetical protein N566_25330 [Streptomycetaceae bacterium MP113-05]